MGALQNITWDVDHPLIFHKLPSAYSAEELLPHFIVVCTSCYVEFPAPPALSDSLCEKIQQVLPHFLLCLRAPLWAPGRNTWSHSVFGLCSACTICQGLDLHLHALGMKTDMAEVVSGSSTGLLMIIPVGQRAVTFARAPVFPRDSR